MFLRELRAAIPKQPTCSAIADFQNSALCAHRVLENRLSPSMLGDSSPELSHTCRYTISIPRARIIFVCYVWVYRATPDFRSPQQTPKTVSRAISQCLAYIYIIRAIRTDTTYLYVCHVLLTWAAYLVGGGRLRESMHWRVVFSEKVQVVSVPKLEPVGEWPKRSET